VSKPAEGALAGFLVRIVDNFTLQLSSEASFPDALAGFGVEGADADAAWACVAANGPQPAKLTTSVPALAAQLNSSSPNLASLVGPDFPVIALLVQFLGGPTQFITDRFKAVRKNADITVSGLLTGPRVSSLITTSVEGDHQVSAELHAQFPNAQTVIGRVIVRLAADTFGEPLPITVEVLGDDADPPGFVAAVVRTPPLPEPLQLSEKLALRLEPFGTPLDIGLTGFGQTVPLGADQPELTLDAGFGSTAGVTLDSPGSPGSWA
jgi:hypothetical protein